MNFFVIRASLCLYSEADVDVFEIALESTWLEVKMCAYKVRILILEMHINWVKSTVCLCINKPNFLTWHKNQKKNFFKFRKVLKMRMAFWNDRGCHSVWSVIK